jgi:predicted amidohydrolase
VALVQQASGLEPEHNRARLEELVPEGADLVVLPEAFARDFGEAGSDVSGYAEPTDGPFATELGRVADDRGATLVAGMFEPSADPERPFNTLVVRGAAEATYRKIHQ